MHFFKILSIYLGLALCFTACSTQSYPEHQKANSEDNSGEHKDIVDKDEISFEEFQSIVNISFIDEQYNYKTLSLDWENSEEYQKGFNILVDKNSQYSILYNYNNSQNPIIQNNHVQTKVYADGYLISVTNESIIGDGSIIGPEFVGHENQNISIILFFKEGVYKDKYVKLAPLYFKTV